MHLDGDTEVPANASLAAGQAIFHLSPDSASLDYKLIVANLDNPIAAHIHVGPPGVNGPVVALLFSAPPAGGTANGVIAEGTITAANLTGPLLGQPFSALVEALKPATRTSTCTRTTACPLPARARAISQPGRSAGTSRFRLDGEK